MSTNNEKSAIGGEKLNYHKSCICISCGQVSDRLEENKCRECFSLAEAESFAGYLSVEINQLKQEITHLQDTLIRQQSAKKEIDTEIRAKMRLREARISKNSWPTQRTEEQND